MQEICRVCGKKVTLEKTYVDSYDKTVKEFSCGHIEKNVLVKDHFQGSDEVVVGYELLFELEKPVYIGGKTQNDEDIELIKILEDYCGKKDSLKDLQNSFIEKKALERWESS